VISNSKEIGMKLELAFVTLSWLVVTAAAAAPDTYVIDMPHSFSYFEVGHLGINTIHGRFNKTSGKITLDRVAKQGTIQAEIDVSSVDTGYARRDELLRSEDYFDVSKFPTITFRSNNLRFKEDTLVGADGELTLLGVTRPVSLELISFKCITHPVNKRDICGAVARTTIKRTEFGMTRASRSLSDEIRISINIEALKA
jgi:polyisoprenoid-binding protein YceI